MMYDAIFTAAVAVLLAHEGGYVNDSSDPGGETKYGISKRAYPELDIANLTEADATEIYYRDYWFRQPWSKFAPTVACKLLDCGVDIGIKSVNVCLQRALRACGKPVAEDGVLGQLSVDAVAKTSPLMLLPALKSEIAAHYRLVAVAKPGEAQDLGGWLNRAYS